jgi:hypothetical protein
MFLYTVVSSTGKLQLHVIIPSAVIEKAQEIRGLVGRPIAFEETLGHHPQQASRMPAVYAFVIDDYFDIGRG